MCDYCSWVDKILAKVKLQTKKEEEKRKKFVDPIIIVHGGAGCIPRKLQKYMLHEVKNAAVTTYNDLLKGRSSVDAVERAISYMESKPYFNCAKGGSLDVNKETAADAAIACGSQAGCVAAVRHVEHPIALARKVMENTEHLLLVANGAMKFAIDSGFQISDIPYSKCESMDRSIKHEESVESVCNEEQSIEECPLDCSKEHLSGGEVCSYCYDPDQSQNARTVQPDILQIGAVGACARDRKKRLSSGSSMAGEPGRPAGCISASGAIIGCGVSADETGCVSVSGDDRCIYVYAPARKINQRISQDASVKDVLTTELEAFERETGVSNIGAVALNSRGDSMVSFKCAHFPWALCQKGFVYYGCSRNEKFSEEIKTERPLDCMCEVSD